MSCASINGSLRGKRPFVVVHLTVNENTLHLLVISHHAFCHSINAVSALQNDMDDDADDDEPPF